MSPNQQPPPFAPSQQPIAGKPITEFVDGVPVDPNTGRPMQVAPVAPGGPAWTEQLKMPSQHIPPQVAPAPSMQVVPANPATCPGVSIAPPPAPDVGAPIAPPVLPLPAIPAPPPAASIKCITEGCNCKPKDRGMCVRCLADTKAYMAKDLNVTWLFLEENGLALPASDSTSGSKFRAGLAAKIAALHAEADKTV